MGNGCPLRNLRKTSLSNQKAPTLPRSHAPVTSSHVALLMSTVFFSALFCHACSGLRIHAINCSYNSCMLTKGWRDDNTQTRKAWGAPVRSTRFICARGRKRQTPSDSLRSQTPAREVVALARFEHECHVTLVMRFWKRV